MPKMLGLSHKQIPSKRGHSLQKKVVKTKQRNMTRGIVIMAIPFCNIIVDIILTIAEHI